MEDPILERLYTRASAPDALTSVLHMPASPSQRIRLRQLFDAILIRIGDELPDRDTRTNVIKGIFCATVAVCA